MLRARSLGIPYQHIPNASILNAVGATGLQLYNFGQTVSMVWFTDNWKPTSFYDRIAENMGIGLHTLILLDIKVKEQSLEDMARGRKVYQPARYMSVSECAAQMLETLEILKEAEEEAEEGSGASSTSKEPKRPVYSPVSLAIGVARLGSTEQKMLCGTLAELAESDLGPPLHSLVLLGKRAHELEKDYIKDFCVNEETFEASWAKYHGR